ncbi:MAG TPA: type II secretion system protein [Thermoanaerobaculia bacterium]|nr:type II secretion system protein [Thermoanaerobaculia bacterium]
MSRTRSSDAQEGFTLAALIVILTIMSIIVAFTVPEQWSLVMKRERDRQTIFLMKQFARGILNWRQKHNNTVPVSLDQLREAREPRMLRGTGKWPCPITGKEDDWILVPPGAVNPATGQANPPAPGPNDPLIGFNSGANNNQNASGNTPRLNKGASPDDYVGPFIGVRPRASGKAFITLNGAENYEEWVYTADDLYNEIQMRLAALSTTQ